VEIECFVHGALCYSLSGLCLFGAMEKDRSGNRGKCPYCCRLPYETERVKTLPFSMRDLRLGEDVRRLAEAGVASAKIEGRMKNALYVASVTRHYRQLLDPESVGPKVTIADLETVFSRRTTKLRFEGDKKSSSPIDPDSLGPLGAEIGTVKRVTKDRDGLSWLRFHTARALERHDGLQFETLVDGRHLGMGITEMRSAISRHGVFEVEAGTDVEVLLPDPEDTQAFDLESALKPGMKIYCSSSQAVKRMFPEPSYRPSDYPGGISLDLTVTLTPTFLEVTDAHGTTVRAEGTFTRAKSPEKTAGAVEKAFSRLGGTAYHLDHLSVKDDNHLFAPLSVLNDLRRDLVERLDERRDRIRHERIEKALSDADLPSTDEGQPMKTIKIALGQKVPAGTWSEVIVTIPPGTDAEDLSELSAAFGERLRLALEVWTGDLTFNRLRATVKALLHLGFSRWEASDLATLRLLRGLNVTDITADWTLYAFNRSALCLLAERGVRRFVASPENGRENLQFLAESGAAVEFLVQQSTPLFLSLHRPAAFPKELACFERSGLWVTTRPVPRTFDVPEGVSTRIDLSWDPF